jgi:hypothetical protein
MNAQSNDETAQAVTSASQGLLPPSFGVMVGTTCCRRGNGTNGLTAGGTSCHRRRSLQDVVGVNATCGRDVDFRQNFPPRPRYRKGTVSSSALRDGVTIGSTVTDALDADPGDSVRPLPEKRAPSPTPMPTPMPAPISMSGP